MRELQAGLWHWQAPHPDWTPEEPWPQEVSSYAIDDGARLLLFDPLAVPSEILELAADREPVVVLTAPVFVPAPDTQEDLVRKFDVTPEQAAGGSPDVAWLLAGDSGEAHLYLAGDRLPIGIEAFPGREHNDLVLWIESRRAIVAGDTLADFGRGLGINEWLRGGVTREQVAEGLQPLLALPVEVVLPAHGTPTDRAALDRALS